MAKWIDELGVEVDRHDRLAQIAATLSDWNVSRVHRIRVERGPIAEKHDEPGIERTRRADEVLAYFEVQNPVEISESVQLRAVIGTRAVTRVRLVFETHHVHNHRSPSALSPSALSPPALSPTVPRLRCRLLRRRRQRCGCPRGTTGGT